MRSIAIGTLAVLAAVYCVAAALLYLLQPRLLFVPQKLPKSASFHFDAPFEERWIGYSRSDSMPGHSRSDSMPRELDSLFFPANDARGTIVYLHGNGGSLANWGSTGGELARRTGMNVWMVDYPGYGKSGGSVPRNEDELQSAGAALYDAALAAEHGDERRLVVYGRSLGSAVAARLAAQRNPGALVLETPFDSLQSLARKLFPWAPAFLIRYPFRSDLDAPKIRCPTLVLHGTADEVIPYAQGATLAKRIPQATLISIRGGHHNDLSSSPTYWTALTRFLTWAR